MQLFGRAPNWQRLIDGIKACCGNPGMSLDVKANDEERTLTVTTECQKVVIPYEDFCDCMFWSIAIAVIGGRVAAALNGRSSSEVRPVAMAPWKDFRGAEIFEGDTIIHPTGEAGKVVFLAEEKEPGDQWRVDYRTGDLSRLCLQIGDKGQACVVAVKEDGNEV